MPRASYRRTRRPASASRRAAVHPVTPPPTTATSARPGNGRCGSGGAGSSSQYGFMLDATPRTARRDLPTASPPPAAGGDRLRAERPVEPVACAHEAGQLELDEGAGDLVRAEAGAPHELVGRRGQEAEER